MQVVRKSVLSIVIGAAVTITACASHASPNPGMVIGRPALAPSGFLDLCVRAPQECGQSGLPVSDVQSYARTLYWSAVLGRPFDAPSSLGAPPISSETEAPPRLEPDPLARRSLWRRMQPRTADRPTAPVLDHTEPLGGARRPLEAQYGPLRVGSQTWEEVEHLNRQVNRMIRQTSDRRLYGVGDFWAIPTGRAARGDCEDYVMAKRRALVDLGLPQARLSIALVETRWGESHAVLLIQTADGEYVLDNLTPKILPWDRTEYRWVKRQIPGRTFDWASLE